MRVCVFACLSNLSSMPLVVGFNLTDHLDFSRSFMNIFD